jgi:hypothetical protein
MNYQANASLTHRPSPSAGRTSGLTPSTARDYLPVGPPGLASDVRAAGQWQTEVMTSMNDAAITVCIETGQPNSGYITVHTEPENAEDLRQAFIDVFSVTFR